MIPLGLYGAAQPVSSAWTPASLPSLAGWWDVSALTGLSDNDPITSMPDLSGNGRTMTAHPYGSAPIYKTGIRAGKPVARFNGTTQALQAASVVATDDTTIEMVLVFAVAGGAGLRTPMSSQRETAPRVGSAMILDASNVRGIYGIGNYATYSGGSYTSSAWERWSLSSNAALYVNGSQVQTGASHQSGSDVNLGASVYTTAAELLEFHVPMDMAEALVFADVLTTTDRASLDAYLTDKWGF